MTLKLGKDTNNAISQHNNNQNLRYDIYHHIMTTIYIVYFSPIFLLVDYISRFSKDRTIKQHAMTTTFTFKFFLKCYENHYLLLEFSKSCGPDDGKPP